MRMRDHDADDLMWRIFDTWRGILPTVRYSGMYGSRDQ